MTDTHVPARGDDEPEQLRDQFRQLLRYRWLIGGGVAVGLIGGAWLGITGADSYAATSEVVLRAPTNDPFNPSVAVDKSTNMGSERQTALSSSVTAHAAKQLGVRSGELRSGLQVTNPPQTMVLRFTYTGSSPGESARRANAVTQAYLDVRKKQWEDLRDTMITKYRDQLAPVAKQQEDLARELKTIGDGPVADAKETTRVNLLNRMTELNAQISNLKSLDMTAGTVNSRATAPTSADGIGILLSLGLGAAVGIAIGLLAAWVRLVFDPAPRSPLDVARAVRAPVLGTLPRGATGTLLVGGQTDARAAEEYRSIAFRLAYDDRFADRRRLLVVAPRGGVEATVAVASNLAASFAETGKDVTLVEADLRTPSLADRLRGVTAARPHWTRTGRGDPDDGDTGWPGSSQLTVDAGESGSFLLVPGERVRNVPRALTSPRTSRLIAEADDPGSTVVVLAPPVLAYADALALVDRVDGVLVVCDPRTVHRAELARIRELIGGAGGTVLGAVIHTERGPHRKRTKKAGRSPASQPEPALPDPALREPVVRRTPDGEHGDTMALRGIKPEELRGATSDDR
ncbi:lipopolysaccharide biosynthesis protein [Streptomyces sp. NPDC058045]|uniref:tyrosine-protein kinase domain-containing protein n=1 Tax=Streptomyces sp. NPDC058045 TaxID=3346311 RepID=UPI0036EDB2E6